MERIIVWLLGLSFALPLYSQVQSEVPKQKLDNLFNILEVNNKFLGSAAILKEGKVVYTYNTGLTKNGDADRSAVNDSTKYRIGSVTKIFTSVMIHQLIEEDKLTFDTPLATYFPNIPGAQKITIRQLLHHRTGLPNLTNEPDYMNYSQEPQTHQEMLERIRKRDLEFEPGTKGEYSNTNYILLGYIIEQITDKSYGENLKDRITDKIGLQHTAYGGEIDTANNEVKSYSRAGNSWEPSSETDMSIPHGAGAIVSTPSELVKFMDALFDHQLINSTMLDSMLVIQNNYGKGIFQFPFGDKKSYGHTGGIDDFSSTLGYFPKEEVAVAITCNAMSYSLNQTMVGGLSILFNKPYEYPTFNYVNISEEERKKTYGIYVSDNFPLDITITTENGQMVASATGQSSFPIFPKSSTKFVNEQVDATFIFDKAKANKYHELTLKQRGMTFIFTRKDVDDE